MAVFRGEPGLETLRKTTGNYVSLPPVHLLSYRAAGNPPAPIVPEKVLIAMAVFREKTGTKSAVLSPKTPFPDIGAFSAFVRDIVLKNPFGCTSYMTGRKNHPPVEKIREMYTAKFVYLDKNRVQVGSGSEVYHTLDGYEDGIAAVVSNTANALAHKGKAKHTPDADLFSATLQCHDPDGTLWFLSIARDRVTISAYKNDKVKERVGAWAKTVPALQ